MPQYFFDLHNDVDAIDYEGLDLPDVQAARRHALGEARAMIQASVADSGRIDLRHNIQVRDETGAILHVIRFEDAVVIKRGEKILTGPRPSRSVLADENDL